MKTLRRKFVILFLVSAFAFQFVTNSLLGTKVSLFPKNGQWYPGIGSSIGWENTLATMIYPLKFVLIEPLSFLGQDPDPVPPILVLAFALYWTVIALVLHYLLSKLLTRKKV